MRKIETRLPEFTDRLKETASTPSRDALIKAFEKCISMYLELRKTENVAVNLEAQHICVAYFESELKS